MRTDHALYQEWLELELDGELRAGERARLETHLQACETCRRQRTELQALGSDLAASRIAVRAGFRTEVLAALPHAGWEARNPRSWRLALALLAILGGGAALLLGLSAARLEPQAAFVEALAAVADLLASSLVAGAGLLGATWRGVTMALDRLFDVSVGNAVAFLLAVLCLDLLFWRLLRSRRPAAPEAAKGSEERIRGHR